MLLTQKAVKHYPRAMDLTQTTGEQACVAYLEKARWPGGIRCPKCSGARISKFTTPASKRSKKYVSKRTGEAKAWRIPARTLHECLDSTCRCQFTAKTGTVFSDSHLPLEKWFLAIALMINSEKGVSALRLKRELGVGYQTAWYLCHRIREAMEQSTPAVDSLLKQRFGQRPET
jgi:Transposase zinc-ribbon domain